MTLNGGSLADAAFGFHESDESASSDGDFLVVSADIGYYDSMWGDRDVSLPEWHSPTVLALLVCLTGLSSGCTIATVRHANGEITTQYDLAVPFNSVHVVSSGEYLDLIGAGVSLAPQGSALGFYRMRVWAIPEDCRLIVMPNSDAEVAALREVLKDIKDVCNPVGLRGEGKDER